MGKVKLSRGFELIPEGRYVFEISDVNFDEKYGTIEIKLITNDGKKHTERFNIGNGKTLNDKALGAFSFFARTAMNDINLDEIEPAELTGHYIGLEIVHNSQPNRNDPTKTVTFANSTEKWAATENDFNKIKEFDLNDFLGL